MKVRAPYCRRSFVGSGIDDFSLPIGEDGGCKAECSTCRNQRLHAHWKDGNLKCFLCGEYKSPDNFFANAKKQHRDGKDLRCKSCKNKSRVEREKYRYKQEPLRRLLVERLAGAKGRAKKFAWPIDIALDDLEDLWERQKGICALSGVPMTFSMFEGRVPTNVSLDQVNPAMGYTKDNIQLVCAAANQMKSNLDMSMLLFFCDKIVAHNASK